MLDLHANLVVSIALNSPITMNFLVNDVNMNGRTLLLQIFLLEEKAKQRRANSDSIVGSIDHQIEFLFRDHLIIISALLQMC